jgi:hypothetical protein
MTSITTYKDKPVFKDRNSPDGLFHYGFRKIRACGDKNGAVLAQGLRFSHEDLRPFIGQWIYIIIDHYWATKARVGDDIISGKKDLLGYLICESI